MATWRTILTLGDITRRYNYVNTRECNFVQLLFISISSHWTGFELKTEKIQIPAWWRHQMETFSALLAICAGNSPVTGEFPAQRPVTRSFDVFFYLRLNKRLSKQSRGWWFETPSLPLWRHSNVYEMLIQVCLKMATVSDTCQWYGLF